MKPITHRSTCPWCGEEKDVVIFAGECPGSNPNIEIYSCASCTPLVREKLTSIIAFTFLFQWDAEFEFPKEAVK